MAALLEAAFAHPELRYLMGVAPADPGPEADDPRPALPPERRTFRHVNDLVQDQEMRRRRDQTLLSLYAEAVQRHKSAEDYGTSAHTNVGREVAGEMLRQPSGEPDIQGALRAHENWVRREWALWQSSLWAESRPGPPPDIHTSDRTNP